MAYGKYFVCDHCGFTIQAWDEGNPYILDIDGKKQYVYHPDPRRYEAIGVDLPHLCLDCGCNHNVDQGKPYSCIRCWSTNRVDSYLLEGHICPKCKKGKFFEEPDRYMIS
ncbi:MAG: hypothetical protein R3C11_01410 [Planctomycetaceae bacterium]